MTGGTISPLTAFLVLRGLKTLELRIHQHARSAAAIAEFLAEQPGVASVSYPGLSGGAARIVYERQMQAGGGLVSFEIDGGIERGRRFMNALKLVSRAVSLGDAETLVQHPASMTHALYSAEERVRHGISDGLIRLSVGLETTEDLLEDIAAALRQA
uniref:PLP-dependent transferase n=1 Tax=Aestuariivirga sp. TaxID=2650926 RepID=UPI0035B19841